MKAENQKRWIGALYILVVIILLIRAKFGFCWSDEAYYVSVANRFSGGDRIISDDWYISQMSAIVLFPLICIYKFFCGKQLEGIYLFLRILYVLGQAFFSSMFYKVMLRKGIQRVPAFLASLVIMFYCKAYIITLSYYSVIYQMFVWLLLLIFDYEGHKKKNGILSGICISIITIINPYFIGIYFSFLIILIVININKKKIGYRIIQAGNAYFRFSLYGILFCCLYVGWIVFRNNSVTDIIYSIPIILQENGYNEGVLFKISNSVLNFAKQYKYTILIISMNFFYTLYLIWRKKLSERRKVFIFGLSFLCFLINCLNHKNWNGGIQAAFAVLGLQIFFLSQKKNYKLMIHFYLPGIIMAELMNLSSDTAFNAMTLGLSVSGAVSCIFVYEYLNEVKYKDGKNRWRYYATILSLCFAIILPAIFRIYVVYRDSYLNNLDTKIAAGPAKGLYTTKEHSIQYNDVIDAMEKYCDRKGMVFISSWCPWAYLCTDMQCGAYTTWRITMENDEEKMALYYKCYPERIPDVVIQLKDEIGKIDIINNFEDAEFISICPQADAKRKTSFLWKYLEDNNYKKIEANCGQIYVRLT